MYGFNLVFHKLVDSNNGVLRVYNGFSVNLSTLSLAHLGLKA